LPDESLQQSALAAPRDRLLAAAGAELEIDVAGVGLDGVQRDVQLGADLTQLQR
jgi:hypothetical protein